MLERLIKKAEDEILHSLTDHLVMDTEIDEENKLLITTSYWKDIEVSSIEFDLTPLIELIKKELDNK